MSLKRSIVTAAIATALALSATVGTLPARGDTGCDMGTVGQACCDSQGEVYGDVFDVGSIASGTFHEYTSLAAIQRAMLNLAVRPPAALRWETGDAGLPGYWAGPGYDPCFVGYGDDSSVTLP